MISGSAAGEEKKPKVQREHRILHECAHPIYLFTLSESEFQGLKFHWADKS